MGAAIVTTGAGVVSRVTVCVEVALSCPTTSTTRSVKVKFSPPECWNGRLRPAGAQRPHRSLLSGPEQLSYPLPVPKELQPSAWRASPTESQPIRTHFSHAAGAIQELRTEYRRLGGLRREVS